MKKLIAIILLVVSGTVLRAQTDECTIGVAVGRATADGRPLLWKTRDYTSEPDNKVRYITAYGFKYIGVTNDGTSTLPWMGVNEYGFAIINSNSTDLPDGSSSGPGNGTLMRMALGSCKTVEDFQLLLDQTNITGRTTNANFGVIDTAGGAAIFETANYDYWRYNADETANGYVLRTNFAFNGGGTGGIERYYRTTNLIADFHSGDSLSYKSILRYQMRDFSDAASQSVAVPYIDTWGGGPFGYVNNDISICRNSSVSAAVIHGTLTGEPARLSTMWTILGQPATSVAVPYWPVDNTPYEADGGSTALLADVANMIRTELYDNSSYSQYINTFKLLNGSGEGLWTRTFPYEDRTISSVELLMQDWRNETDLPPATIKYTEDTLATSTYQFLLSCYQYLTGGMTGVESSEVNFNHQLINASVYPNPFAGEATLTYEVEVTSDVTIEVYSLTGTVIERGVFPARFPGEYEYRIGTGGANYPAGLLLIKLQANGVSRYLKVIKR